MKINRVLIVDDKEENLYLLQSLLQGHSYEVVTAAHGAEALVKARQNPPDLIISDLLMPMMDGYTLLRNWKADERLKTIPFVVYTATYIDERDERLARDLGADDFILKPTEPEPFIARINEAIAKAKHTDWPAVRTPVAENPVLIKEFNEVQVRKLEEKTLQLEESNRALQQEILERKRAEEALLQSESHLLSVVQTAGDAIVTMDAQGKVLFWNGAAESMFGHLSAEMIGQPLIGLLPERFRDGFQQRPKHPIVTGQLTLGQHPVEAIGLRRNGGEFPAEITISSWKEKKETFSTAIIRDITERKHGVEEMRKRVRELEGMNRISTILRIASILEKMLPSLLEETLAIMESDTGAIWLFDPGTGTLRRVAARGWLAATDNAVSKLGDGFPGGVFTTNQVHVSDEFAHDPKLHALLGDSIPAGWGGACIPIQSEKDVIGMACIALKLPRKISPEEVNLLGTLSEMAGTAIQRTRLIEQTINQLERLSTLHAIDTAINASMDIKVTLGYILDQIMNQLRVDAAAVLLCEPRLLILDYFAGRGFRGNGIKATRMRVGEGHAGRAALERHLIHVADMAHDPIAQPERVAGEEFVSHTAIPLISKGQVIGVLELFHRSPFTPEEDWLEFLNTLAGQAAIAINNAALFSNLESANVNLARANDATLEGWSRAMDLRDKETEGHSQRVTETTLILAQRMGLGEEQLVHIRRGALLHDLGKLGVPDYILNKPGSLNEEEMANMHRHPALAYELLLPIEFLRPALDIPYCHHERWDGSGYPRGLKGEQIPLSARIFAVGDVFDALTSDRPYRNAWSHSKARDYIREQSGKEFDPQVVDAFLREEK